MRKVTAVVSGAERCRRKFLRYFPNRFQLFAALLAQKNFAEIAAEAVRIEWRTNLHFSFEKMALRDAVKTNADGVGPRLLGRRFLQW